MGTTIRAIQTRYAGCHFRSRLEARWAVLFDHLGIAWEYEPQGFEIRDRSRSGSDARTWRYLPDFYLPATQTWVEVKGDQEHLTADYRWMLGEAIDFGGQLPHVEDSQGTARGLLILGPVPATQFLFGLPVHPILQHQKGGWISYASLSEEGVRCEWTNWYGPEDFDISLDPPVIDIAARSMRGRAPSRATIAAYTAARSARFEHGAAS